MKPAPSTAFQSRRNERGVALIIVLGFLGLMVMMAVAFMIQARVERMVADSTLEGLRARQIAQTGIAAAIQDYMNHIKGMGDDRSATMNEMYWSGKDKDKKNYPGKDYDYSRLLYGSTNLWNGEAGDWLPDSVLDSDEIDIDDVDQMEWIWVRQKPSEHERILGRYAYVCFNLSGGVDANLLGRAFGQDIPGNGYGAQTNRDNVRKMLLNGVRADPKTGDSGLQLRLARYQEIWQGFDTPAALKNLTDGKNNDGQNSGANRWANYDMDEKTVGVLPKDYLSCYSYAATHKGGKAPFLKESDIDSLKSNESFRNMVGRMGGGQSKSRKSKRPSRTISPTVRPLPIRRAPTIPPSPPSQCSTKSWPR